MPTLSTILFIVFFCATSSVARADSFLEFLARISGISATSGAQKSLDEQEQSAGQLWLATIPELSRSALTTESGYRSPVFEPKDKGVIALKGSEVVRVSLQSGIGEVNLCAVRGINKLIGFPGENPDEVVVLLTDKDGNAICGVLTLKSGQVRKLPFDEKLKDHREMMKRLKSSERTYGITRLYPQARSPDGTGGRDIYLDKDDGSHVNVSEAGKADCGQPALSHDEHLVVYLKTGE
jgi:hypothetical protein